MLNPQLIEAARGLAENPPYYSVLEYVLIMLSGPILLFGGGYLLAATIDSIDKLIHPRDRNDK